MQIKQFEIASRSGKILVKDKAGNVFELQPAECQNVVTLVGTAASMLELPALPSVIAGHPFEIHFSSTGNCVLTRVDGESRVEFDKTNFDGLIEAVEVAVNNFVDARRINKAKGRKVRQHGFNYPDPTF